MIGQGSGGSLSPSVVPGQRHGRGLEGESPLDTGLCTQFYFNIEKHFIGQKYHWI